MTKTLFELQIDRLRYALLASGEWQAGYVNYKFIRSNENPVYYT